MIVALSYVHIISDRFSFRFTELYGMIWTHFPFYIYVGYKFKSFEHYFNVFWWKIQPSEKNTRESTAIVVTKNVERIKNWFLWADDEIQFLDSLANSNFGCYCSRSASLIIISILRAVNPANICWSSIRLEDVFKTCLEDVFNTSSA